MLHDTGVVKMKQRFLADLAHCKALALLLIVVN